MPAAANLSALPAPTAPLIDETGRKISVVWHRYFSQQFAGNFPQKYPPLDAPQAPTSGFVIYCDAVDGHLKSISSNGTVTVLAQGGA